MTFSRASHTEEVEMSKRYKKSKREGNRPIQPIPRRGPLPREAPRTTIPPKEIFIDIEEETRELEPDHHDGWIEIRPRSEPPAESVL